MKDKIRGEEKYEPLVNLSILEKSYLIILTFEHSKTALCLSNCYGINDCYIHV